MKLPDATELARALAAHPRAEHPALPGRRNHLRAGILVPLRFRAGDVSVVLTERAADLRHHGGEISFPGGKPDASDPTLEATALREAREEIGLKDAHVLGRLSSIPLYTSDFRLEPFVAEIAGDARFVPSPSEVARVLELSVAGVLDQERWNGIPWTTPDGRVALSPVFELDERLVYGGTAHALYELLVVVARAAGARLPALTPGPYSWSDVLAVPP
ncbi:MAG: CoA pyrophosphatase [Myxococcales bacterium]|nr:CoA pyrophosphatase [Myxococcales bacterium]